MSDAELAAMGESAEVREPAEAIMSHAGLAATAESAEARHTAEAIVPLAELTYTSFDSPTTQRGGWQVKQARGQQGRPLGEDDPLLGKLSGRIRTFLTPVSPLPKFPGESELADRVRRLVYRPLDDGLGGLWHTIDAGADGTGRPGNVFVHAALFNRGSLPVRAIDLWRSGTWLKPYGASEVTEASLGRDPWLGVRDIQSPAGIEEFINGNSAPPHRIAVLGALLDAVAHSWAGDAPGVALIVETPEEAAAWISAVSHWTSRDFANRLGWSTFERAHDLTTRPVEGLVVAGVPVQDRAAVLAGDHGRIIVATDDESFEDVAGSDSDWNCSGVAVPKTPWSTMVMNTFVTMGAATDAVTALGGMSSCPDLGLPERLHAALAEYLLGQDSDGFRWARDAAKSSYPQIALLCRGRNAGENGARAYIEAALADADWMTGPCPAPADVRGVDLTPKLSEAIRNRIATITHLLADGKERFVGSRRLGRAAPADEESLRLNVVLALRFVDFLVRLGLDARSTALEEELAALAGLAVEVLQAFSDAGQDSIAIAAAVDPLDPLTEKRYLDAPLRRLSTQDRDSVPLMQRPPGRGAVADSDVPGGHPGVPQQTGRSRASEPEWVERLLGWGRIGVDIPGDVHPLAADILERLGMSGDPLFLACPDATLRPQRERIALAVLASLRHFHFLKAAEELNAAKEPDRGRAWVHSANTARWLLDGMPDTAERLQACAGRLIEFLSHFEGDTSKAPEHSVESASYRRLLAELVESDSLGPSRLRSLLSPVDGRQEWAKSPTLRCCAEKLGVSVPKPEGRGRGWKGLVGR